MLSETQRMNSTRRRPTSAAVLLLTAVVLGAALGLAVPAASAAATRSAAKKPAVSRVTPAGGPVAGGATVTVTGRGFRRAGRSLVKQVRFGAKAATQVHVRSTCRLTAIVPAGARAGAVYVTVRTSAGRSAKAAAARYTYSAAVAYQVTADTYAPPAGGAVAVSAQLVDETGAAVAEQGVAVTWSTTGGGSLSAATSSTDAQGAATVTVTTSAVAGACTVLATDAWARTGVTPTITSVGATYAVQGMVKGYSSPGADGAQTIKPLAGATVIVRIDAADPLYDAAAAADNLVGTASTGADGSYTVDAGAFRSAPLPTGTVVDVAAVHAGHLSVLQYGVYDRPVVVVSFQNYSGKGYGNRTLPYDNGTSLPPVPFEYLLPNHLTAP
jgi:hypothetical protein